MRKETFWLLTLVVVVAAFWQHWHVLGATPFPIGVDGYFYPIQVRSILEHGVLRYPASPVTFYWMAPFAAVTDPIVGAKLGAALGCALIAVPAYGIGAKFSKPAGVIAAVIAATSAGDGFLAIEFVKQGIGLTVALGALWMILHALDQPTRRRLGLAIGAVIVTFATHKLAAAIVVVVAIPAIVIQTRKHLRGRRLIYAAIAGLIIALAIIVLGLVAPQRFLSLHDLHLLKHLFGPAHWDAPALVMPGGASLDFDYEAAIGGVVAIAAAIVIVKRRIHWAWPIVILGLVIALPWIDVRDPQGLGFRLRLTAFVPLALNAAIVASEIKKQTILLAIAAGLLCVELAGDRTEGEVLTHPALVAAVKNIHVPDGDTVIVPERHILFMVDWYTRADISLRPEAIPYLKRLRLLNLPFIGGAGSPLDHALDAARELTDPPIALHADYRNGLVLVTEPTWAWLLSHLPADLRAHYAAWPTI